jgi:PAS domain S-box-containing protein
MEARLEPPSGDVASEQRRVADELEERVAQRTSELAAANEALRQEVAERRRAEDALRESVRDAALIMDGIPGLVALLTADGGVEVVNRQVLEYSGRTLEELRRWGTSDIVHPEDLPHVIEVFTRSIAAGSPYDIVQRLRRSDGVYRWFQNSGFPLRDPDGHVTRWCVLLTDVDERKHAEDALTRSERNLRQIIDAIPAQAWCLHADGRVAYLNERWHEYTGISREEAYAFGARGVPGHEATATDVTQAIMHPDDAPRAIAKWLHEILPEGRPGEFEVRLRRFDGAYRWFIVRAEPMRDEHGTIVQWYGTNTDIEDRRRAEAALDRARSELAHVSRETSLGALAASIAHEVNQPLAGIITNASTCLRMLAADPPDVDGARETARRTIRDGNRASDVITRLRALFSQKDFTLEPVDLNEATREVVALSLSDLQRNRVILQPELADDLPPITGDRVQLQQVILNLIRNASDAMAGVNDRPRQLVLRTERDGGDRVRLTVRDAGVGVDVRSVEKLFDAFYTTKDGGMGIGLAVSRSIVERHHGRLWAEPNHDAGATFAFSIPVDT